MQGTGLARFKAVQLDRRAFEILRLTSINLPATARRFVQQHRTNTMRHQRLRRTNPGRTCANDDHSLHTHLIHEHCKSPVEASLLAMVAAHSTDVLADK